jgi:hypothetical protein
MHCSRQALTGAQQQQQAQEELMHAGGAVQQHGSMSCSNASVPHQQQHQLLDMPAHLLEPHMQQQLQPQDRAALLQSSKALAELALRTAPRVRFSMGLTGGSRCVRCSRRRQPPQLGPSATAQG